MTNYTIADFLRETGYEVETGKELATNFADYFMALPSSGLLTDRSQLGWAYIVAGISGTVDVVGMITTASSPGTVRVRIYDRASYIDPVQLPETLKI